MLTKSSPISTQSNLFHSELFSQLDVKDPLIQLANTINWTVFDDAFEQHYSQNNGRPSKSIRLMVGLLLPKKALKRDNRYQQDKKRKLCKRRAAIEPIIGHLKSDFRLSRNLLKGQVGDEINVLMAACAWNLREWLVIATIFLFWQKLGLFFVKYLRFFVVLDKKQFC
ncbi:hypothetical protein BPUTEOSOX_1650 [thiotrophic endosymbiont of Bathymodiolus puteoserpentis (Logatchev)]|nr:hypothetical protein BPUTEOSOX_1650 [thiotrophic endosymbiont of Bathymodiolus puteoserpentis (Logatchev)]